MTRYCYPLLCLVILSWLSTGVYAAVDGEQVYQEKCASCHDSGAPRTPKRETLNTMSPATIIQALETGAMRVVGTWAMDGPQRVAVAEYLTGKTFDSNWKASSEKRCAAPMNPSKDPLAAPHWNGWGNGLENTRFQSAAMAGVSKSDVAKLELQWVYAFPGETMVETQPTVIDGRIYMGSRSGTFYALDAKTGCSYWTFQAEAPIKATNLVASIGENAQSMVFFGDIAGWIYALDATSGKLIWKIRGGAHPAARITGGPQLFEDHLYFGITSLEEGLAVDPNYLCCTFRGSVVKIHAATGRMIWETFTIDQIATLQGKSSQGSAVWGPSGASVWSAPTLDTKLRRVYVATSDNYSHPATDSSDAIMAISMDTGEHIWTYQGLAGDVWNVACHNDDTTNCPDDAGPDEDMGSSPLLITLPSGKRILAAGQKTGVIHVVDPDQRGKLLWQKKVAKGGVLGGIEWAMATDGKRIYASKSDILWKDQRFNTNDTVLNPDAGGGLAAVDVVSGEVVWEAPPVSCAGRKMCSPGQPAAVTVIPDVVFSGSVSGVMRAFDASTGDTLWEYDTLRNYDAVNGAAAKGGAIDGPGVVVANGWVYVTSGYAKFGGAPGNVLLAFKAP